MVGKLIIPADFLVRDIEEDENVPNILGRPFLATGKALIDVEKGELTLRVNGEEVTYNVSSAMKFTDDRCYAISSVENFSSEQYCDVVSGDALATALMNLDETGEKEVLEYVQF